MAYQAMKAVYSLEETTPLDEDFFKRKLFSGGAGHKKIYQFILERKHSQPSSWYIMCEYKDYSAVYSVIDYGFSYPDGLEPVDDVWINPQNSPQEVPDVTVGVTVDGKRIGEPILAVCSFYPNVF